MQDEDNLREALRYSAALLGELRTSLLGPQKYYELYMQASDELQNLQVRGVGNCAAWRGHACMLAAKGAACRSSMGAGA
jgi:hypothetical protein